LTKCQQSDHLKFGEALYFNIHPSFGPENTFQSYSYAYSSKSGDFIHIFNRNGKFLAKKLTFKWQKVDIYFEMVQFDPMVPIKKGLMATN